MRVLVGLVAGCSLLIPSIAAGQQGFVLRSERRPEPLRIELPLTERSICNIGFQWSLATGVPIGMECRWDPARQLRNDDRVREALDLTGLSANDSLKLIAEHLPGYTAFFKQGVAVFRQTPRGERSVFLDRVVGYFVLDNVTLEDAAYAVYDLVSGVQRRAIPGRPPRTPPPISARVSIDVKDATVETILTTICQSYGNGLSWRVGYLTDEHTAVDSTIQFINASLGVSAGSNMVRRVDSTHPENVWLAQGIRLVWRQP